MTEKYKKYKYKYLDLKIKYYQLGGEIHRADEVGVNIDKCGDVCNICDESGPNYNNDKKIILNCECCFHIDCILRQISMSLGDKNSLTPNGIKCPNSHSFIGTCEHPDRNITPDDLTVLFQTFVDINLNEDQQEIIDLAQFRRFLAEINAGHNIIDENQLDPFILATTKPCPEPTCQNRISRYHGHACHHISPLTYGCPNCHTHFCYSCLSSATRNRNERGYEADCNCNWLPRSSYLGDGVLRANWSSFCNNEIEEANISYDRGTPYDNRCGCFFCPDCQPGNRCADCVGNCVVCLGLVKPGPRELYHPGMGNWCIRVFNKYNFSLINNINFNNIDTTRISSLTFSNCNFTIIKKEWFSSNFNNLIELTFDNCKIKSIEKNSFINFTSLTSLVITNNLLTDIPTTFSSCRNLITLDLTNNKITSLNETRFPNSLISLILKNNKIFGIHNNAFSNLSLLEILDLQQNKIDIIKPEYFTQLIRLINLNLNNNKIKSINALSFSNMNSLFNITINGNLLETIKTNTFINLNNLRQISLNGNIIKKIEKDAFNSCNNLFFINLKSNSKIQIISNSFRRLPKLKNISITNPDSFKNVKLPNNAFFRET